MKPIKKSFLALYQRNLLPLPQREINFWLSLSAKQHWNLCTRSWVCTMINLVKSHFHFVNQVAAKFKTDFCNLLSHWKPKTIILLGFQWLSKLYRNVFLMLPMQHIKILGPVVQRPISANPGLNFNPGFFFFCLKAFSRIIFPIKLNLLFKLLYQNSNFPLTLGYLTQFWTTQPLSLIPKWKLLNSDFSWCWLCCSSIQILRISKLVNFVPYSLIFSGAAWEAVFTGAGFFKFNSWTGTLRGFKENNWDLGRLELLPASELPCPLVPAAVAMISLYLLTTNWTWLLISWPASRLSRSFNKSRMTDASEARNKRNRWGLCEKNALYLSVKVFSTKLLIGDHHFTWSSEQRKG